MISQSELIDRPVRRLSYVAPLSWVVIELCAAAASTIPGCLKELRAGSYEVILLDNNSTLILWSAAVLLISVNLIADTLSSSRG